VLAEEVLGVEVEGEVVVEGGEKVVEKDGGGLAADGLNMKWWVST